MAVIQVSLKGDGAWPDLKQLQDEAKLVDCMGDNPWQVQFALLKNGTVGGRHTVGIRFDLPDGQVLVTEVTLRNLEAAIALMSGYADEEGRQ